MVELWLTDSKVCSKVKKCEVSKLAAPTVVAEREAKKMKTPASKAKGARKREPLLQREPQQNSSSSSFLSFYDLSLSRMESERFSEAKEEIPCFQMDGEEEPSSSFFLLFPTLLAMYLHTFCYCGASN